MSEQDRENKPSPQGKVSAGIAATAVGYAAYKTHIYNKYPKSAQTGVKVPSSPNTPRSAASSATSSASWYSTRAKASIGIKNLENSYRMRGATWRGGGGSSIASAVIGYVGGEILQPLVIPPLLKAGTRWSRQLGGITPREAAMLTAAIDSGKVRNISEAVGFIERQRSYQKQLPLLQPPESREVQAIAYPFTGGQSNGVLYKITATGKRTYSNGAIFQETYTLYAWGPIASVKYQLTTHTNSGASGVGFVVNCRGGKNGDPNYNQADVSYSTPTVQGDYKWYAGSDPNQTPTLISAVVERANGQPDTGGNLPPTFEPIFSVAAGITIAPYTPTIGEVESPPPALISQSGEPLYDAARVPLQRVMDGTAPPWARAENPIAKMPSTRIVPSAPAAPLDIPQPDVAPSPNKDDKPVNPYPFFDPITFPDTTTPDIFDIPPAFKPKPLTVQPLVVEPLRPSTDKTYNPAPVKIPASVPSTGTPFAPNPTTRNPEVAPKTKTPVKSEPAPEKSPTEKVLEQLPGIATGIAILTPIVRGIQAQTTPETIVPLVKEGTCQSLNGGCTNGVNIPNQLAQNGTKLDALQVGLQGLDLSLLGTIDQKLGAQIPNGGIGGFLQRAFQATRLDKIINALTLITTLHNAAMLSRNLGQTLGDLTSQALAAIGIKDENNSPLDINAEIGRQVNNLMSTVLGADVWAGTKENWNKANRIISSANQIMWTVRSIADSGREVTEWIANNTGKIGNALKRFRVVGENAYPHMAENVTHQNAWMLKVQRYREGVDTLDDAASSLQGVLGEVQNIQQEAQELNEQKQRFDAAIASAQPKTIPDNNPVKDKASATKTASASPANQANVFRGTGENANA